MQEEESQEEHSGLTEVRHRFKFGRLRKLELVDQNTEVEDLEKAPEIFIWSP